MHHGLNEHETRELLKVGLEYSYLHEDWVHPLREVLEGLSAKQAAWMPGEQMKGVWDIVLHLTAWNCNIIERIETGEKARPKEGAWPPMPEVKSEEAWAAAQSDLWASVVALTALVDSVPLEKVRSSPYGFGDLLCRFTHMAYHCGQIVKLREIKGW
jgi:hypothetical protein